MFDLNRLQPWFYVYNAILLVFLFYNGRVDDPNKFTSIFIFVQVIISSVYLYNGFNQLRNPLFIVSDFYDVILPLKEVLSQRQFLLALKIGQIAPYITMFVGLGMLVRPVKYLAISMGLIMHLFLFILLFPSVHNSNYALWFMNLVFGFMILFLFSGKTQQRYFSYSFLFQKPLFYILVAAFWIMPALNSFNYWPAALSFNFKSGSSVNENMSLSESAYNNLPLYIRAFCEKNNEGYVLKVRHWCSNELRSEYFNHDLIVKDGFRDAMQVVTAAPPLPEGELSVK
ncbi:MAG: hypothetical protein ACXVDC_15085 [Bacteroidia bacterium]